MTEAEVVQIVREHFESLFPKACPNCGHRYVTLLEYVQRTKPIGPPTSFDAESGDWHTNQPIGSVVQANCACGTTLALSTETMPLPKRQALLGWIKVETERRGLSPGELLAIVRENVRSVVLAKGK
jgi:hypothetical protein